MVRTIVSLWPLDLRTVRPRYSPVAEYIIPAAPFDGFTLFKVTDQQETDYMGAGQRIKQVVPAEDLANDLVQQFKRQACGQDGEVGIFVWESEQEPTEAAIRASAEYAEQRRLQGIAMKNIVITARNLKETSRENLIGTLHHTAAAYLQIEGEAWQGTAMTRDSTKECVFCRSFISAKAIICPKCSQIVDAEGHVKLQAEIKARIDALSQQNSMIPDNGGSALRPALALKGK